MDGAATPELSQASLRRPGGANVQSGREPPSAASQDPETPFDLVFEVRPLTVLATTTRGSTMPRMMVDCRDVPSDSGCSLAISGEERHKIFQGNAERLFNRRF